VDGSLNASVVYPLTSLNIVLCVSIAKITRTSLCVVANTALLKQLPLASFPSEVGPEAGVMLDDKGGHRPDYPREMPVAPLRYPAGPFELA
jgi:hypothetical protein